MYTFRISLINLKSKCFPKTDPYLLAFSLRKNVAALCSLKRDPSDLQAVHGIRFVNAFLLVVFPQINGTLLRSVCESHTNDRIPWPIVDGHRSSSGHLHRCLLDVQRTADSLFDNWKTAAKAADAPVPRIRRSNDAHRSHFGSSDLVLHVHSAESIVGSPVESGGWSACGYLQAALVEKYAIHS